MNWTNLIIIFACGFAFCLAVKIILELVDGLVSFLTDLTQDLSDKLYIFQRERRLKNSKSKTFNEIKSQLLNKEYTILPTTWKLGSKADWGLRKIKLNSGMILAQYPGSVLLDGFHKVLYNNIDINFDENQALTRLFDQALKSAFPELYEDHFGQLELKWPTYCRITKKYTDIHPHLQVILPEETLEISARKMAQSRNFKIVSSSKPRSNHLRLVE